MNEDRMRTIFFGTYKCVDTDGTGTTGSGNEKIEITVPTTFNTITYRRVFVMGEYTSDPLCKQETDDGNGNFVLEVPFGTTPCRQALSGSTGQITFILAQSLSQIQDTDVKFVTGGQCDYSVDPTQTIQTVGVSVGDLTQTGQADHTQEILALAIVKQDNSALDLDQSNVPSCAMGDPVKLQITLTKSASAQGAHIITCNAYPSEAAVTAGTPTLSMIATSCAVDESANGFSSGLTTSTGFGQSMVGNDNTASGSFITRTGTFKCFQFNEAQLLVIQCTAGFCPTGDAMPCNSDNCVAATARRRRDIRNETDRFENTPQFDSVIATVHVENKPIQTRIKGSTASDHCESALNETMFISIIVVMATLLLLAMSTSIYLGCIFTRNRQQMMKERQGVDNAGV